MTGSIARRLTALEDRLTASSGRTIAFVVDPHEPEEAASQRLEHQHGPITSADTVFRIHTGVPRARTAV